MGIFNFFSKKEKEPTPLFDPIDVQFHEQPIQLVENKKELSEKLMADEKYVLPRKINEPNKRVFHYRVIKHVIYPISNNIENEKYVIYTIQYTTNKGKNDESWYNLKYNELHSIDCDGTYYLSDNNRSFVQFNNVDEAIQIIEFIKEGISEGGSFIVYEE